MKLPWKKSEALPAEGETITLQVREGRLVPTWWDMAERGTEPFEKGYDRGFLDGINLRYRAERSGKIPAVVV